jgi:hypothetical protein
VVFANILDLIAGIVRVAVRRGQKFEDLISTGGSLPEDCRNEIDGLANHKFVRHRLSFRHAGVSSESLARAFAAFTRLEARAADASRASTTISAGMTSGLTAITGQELGADENARPGTMPVGLLPGRRNMSLSSSFNVWAGTDIRKKYPSKAQIKQAAGPRARWFWQILFLHDESNLDAVRLDYISFY